jgi:hypothetical protein
VIETPNLFLLYHGAHEYQIIPKRAFTSPEDMAMFHRLLAERIGDRREGGFPVQLGG